MIKLGGVTLDTASKVEQLTAKYSDFQVAFGGVITSLADGAIVGTGALDALTEGALAWQTILNDQLPVIVENTKATQDQIETFDEFSGIQREITTGSTQIAKAEAKAAAEAKKLASANMLVNEATRLTAQIAGFAVQGIEEETIAFEGLSEELQRQIALGPEFLSAQEKIQVILAKNSEQIEVQAARMAGLAASFGAAADFTRVTPEEAIAAQQPEVEVKIDAKKVGSSISSAISDQLQTIKSAISQVSGLTFGEILPPQETFRVDEWARRMAAVAQDGKNEWVNVILQEFGGQEFIRPFEEAVATGDPSAISAAAQNIINGESLFELMDIEGAVTQVEGLIAEQNLQQRINDAILNAITGEGGELPAGAGIGGGPLLNAIGLGEGADPGAAIGTAVSELGIPAIVNEALAAETGAEGTNPLLALLGLGEDGTFDEAIATLTGEKLPAISEAFNLFFIDATLGFEQVLLATQNEDAALVTMSTTTLPQLQAAMSATATVIITKLKEIDKGTASSTKIMQKLRDTIGKELTESIESATKEMLKFITALEKAVSLRERMRPTGGVPGAGAGIGFRYGVGFQQGTSPLGFRVPAGFPNDTFPINVTSGERVVVSPPGRSIEQVTGMGAPRVEVNINGVTISNGMDLNMFEGRVTRAVTKGFAQ